MPPGTSSIRAPGNNGWDWSDRVSPIGFRSVPTCEREPSAGKGDAREEARQIPHPSPVHEWLSGDWEMCPRRAAALRGTRRCGVSVGDRSRRIPRRQGNVHPNGREALADQFFVDHEPRGHRDSEARHGRSLDRVRTVEHHGSSGRNSVAVPPGGRLAACVRAVFSNQPCLGLELFGSHGAPTRQGRARAAVVCPAVLREDEPPATGVADDEAVPTSPTARGMVYPRTPPGSGVPFRTRTPPAAPRPAST